MDYDQQGISEMTAAFTRMAVVNAHTVEAMKACMALPFREIALNSSFP
jgi:hypothetical protein